MAEAVTTFDVDALTADLIRDEGLKLKPYTDTVGKLTIGIGRNLTDRGISRQEALVLARNDVDAAAAELDRFAPWWRSASEARRRALLNMTFNMGWPRVSGFAAMLAALQAGDYGAAADAALDSVWARQVGARALRVSELIRRG
jgi:lysozyme